MPLTRSDLNASGIELVLTDLDTAMTFLNVAEVTRIPETAVRNHENARHAYDTVLRLLRHLHPTPEQQRTIEEKLSVLKTRLRAAGQQF
jgi:hypothetical protein